MITDIKASKINTVICTSLDRVSRSVKDFLEFMELINNYNIHFISMKEKYDTSTSQGRFFITMVMAMAQLEREQTSERNTIASYERAKRGLWNGGHIMGYDLDSQKKGPLTPHKEQVAMVNCVFDTYLEIGSVFETAKAMNRKGFRTKEYRSRYDKFHPAKEFTYSTILGMLTNYAYIGKKEINKKRRRLTSQDAPEEKQYQIVDACWPAIVSDEKFYQVQSLLNKNSQIKHNGVKPIKHNYLLNGGLLYCGYCNSEMEGRSGTGRKGNRYYYYNSMFKFLALSRVSPDTIRS